MKRVCLLFLFMFAFVLFPATAIGQAQTGTPPFGSFGGGPDVIDLANLNSHIIVPVIHKPGRGQNLAFDITYDSAIWYPVGASGSQSWTNVTNWGWQGTTGIVSPYVGMFKILTRLCLNTRFQETGETDSYTWSFTNQAAITSHFGTTTGGWGTCNGVPVPPPTSINVTATNGTGYSFSATGGAYTSLSDSSGKAIDAPVNTQTPLTGPMTTDRNGNEISYNGGIIDTLGVTMLTESGVAPNPVVFSYPVPGGTGTAKVTVNYTSYTVATNFGVSGIKEFGATAVSLVSSIALPDGTQYTFNYEPTPSVPSAGACTPLSGTYSHNCVTARLASITLPTGGSIQYTYSGGNNGVLTDGTVATLRRQTPDGTWTYTRSLGASPASTDIVTDPAGNDTVIQFQGIYETQRQVYSGSHTSGTLLQTTNTCYNNSASPCTATAVSLPITSRVAIIQDNPTGLECKHATSWSTSGLMTEQDDYDYGNGAPGALIRKELITYASLGNNILNAPSQITIENGSGTVQAQTTISYDAGSTVATQGTPQHTSISGSRGNATSVSHLVAGQTSLTQSFTYFDTGNLDVATDVNGATTSYTYAACGNSFPTSISEPLNLSKAMAWNCTGGVATSSTDENGNAVSTTYNDPDFWRPAQVTDQGGNQTNLSYGLNPTTFESSMAFNGTGSLVDILDTYDALGRVKTAQKREAPSSANFDSVETDYDSSARPSRTTVPYVGIASGTSGSTPAMTQTYDALNRPVLGTDGGGGTVTLTYTGNDVLQTIGPTPAGENPKRKQSEYNSIGQLTSVCEITGATGSGTCGQTTSATGYWTKYTYDAAGRLLNVSQNAQSGTQIQTRTFVYNLVGQMNSENNPETGNINYTYNSDGTCGTSNGDLVRRSDPAGNVTCYAYDQIHRVTSITYPSGPNSANTPGKYFIYDAATVNGVAMVNAKSRLAEAYTATCQTCSKITDEGFSYTARGELSDVYESTPHSSGYYHATATYWANGALDTLNATNGYATNYNLDGEGRVYSAGPSGNQLASTVYNSASEPTIVTFASLDSDSFTYDPNTFRMTQYKYTVGATPKTVVGNLTWNANGTLGSLGITDAFNAANTQNCTYSYDDLARLASGNCGSVWSQTFTYDAFGNITKSGSMQFQPGYNWQTNRMATGASYDAMGDVSSDGLHSYGWNSDTRPTTIDTATVTYDAFGRMVEQSKAGANTEIEYSPTGFAMQLMNGQAWVKEFVPMPGGTEEVWQSSGASPYYRHADWLGSSRFASTSSTRAMYNDLAFAPFGETYAPAGSTGVTDISFAGNSENTTTNLYDAQVREYGIQGRWPSPDPAGLKAVNPSDPQTWNRYAYVRNNPLLLRDTSGTKQCYYVQAEPQDTSQQVAGFGPYVDDEEGGGGEVCGGFDSPFGGDSGDYQIGIDGGFGPASLAGGGMGAMGDGFGGSNADVQCPDNVCSGFGQDSNGNWQWVQFNSFEGGPSGYFYAPDLTNGINAYNGQIYSDANYQQLLQQVYASQIASQCARVTANTASDFGGSASVSCGNPTIIGGHANFALDCGNGPCPAVGRYDNGVHIECAAGGNCGPNDPLVVHDDTVSPWVGSFSFSAVFTGNFWEHGFADLIYGSVCDCVLPH